MNLLPFQASLSSLRLPLEETRNSLLVSEPLLSFLSILSQVVSLQSNVTSLTVLTAFCSSSASLRRISASILAFSLCKSPEIMFSCTYFGLVQMRCTASFLIKFAFSSSSFFTNSSTFFISLRMRSFSSSATHSGRGDEEAERRSFRLADSSRRLAGLKPGRLSLKDEKQSMYLTWLPQRDCHLLQ